VNFIGEEKRDFSPSDLVGTAAYARIDPTITYTEVDEDRRFSDKPTYRGSVKVRIVVFQINKTPKLHPVKTENKILGDLMDMNFNSYTGKEQQIRIEPISSNLNFYDNFVQEVSKDYTVPTDSIIIALNCTLSWEAGPDECEKTCNVYEETC
jgi:hypothetical protein